MQVVFAGTSIPESITEPWLSVRLVEQLLEHKSETQQDLLRALVQMYAFAQDPAHAKHGCAAEIAKVDAKGQSVEPTFLPPFAAMSPARKQMKAESQARGTLSARIDCVKQTASTAQVPLTVLTSVRLSCLQATCTHVWLHCYGYVDIMPAAAAAPRQCPLAL